VKKNTTSPGEPMPFLKKVCVAGFAGGCGGIVGTPADMVNVRYDIDLHRDLMGAQWCSGRVSAS
jgi:dicarboxylate transporter 10